MKTLHAHDLEIKEEMKLFWKLTGDTPLDLEKKQIDFITNQNKQLYIKIAEGELKRLKKNLETELAIDRFAHPDYHKGYEMAFHENTFYWNNILQELNK